MGIFKSGDKSSFAKKSRSMARMIALGAGSLAVVFLLFMFFYFKPNVQILRLSAFLPITYLAIYVVSFSKINNKSLYNFIFYIFIFTAVSLLFIAFKLSFNPEYLIIMLVVFNIILYVLPTLKQLLLFFSINFILLVAVLFFVDIPIGLKLLILASFGYAFSLSYVISLQKKQLTEMLRYFSYYIGRFYIKKNMGC